MHPHSLIAWQNLEKTLTQKQLWVYGAYENGQPLTDEQVTEILGTTINKVSGRVGELITKGFLKEVGVQMIGGRPRRLCAMVERFPARFRPEVEKVRRQGSLLTRV